MNQTNRLRGHKFFYSKDYNVLDLREIPSRAQDMA